MQLQMATFETLLQSRAVRNETESQVSKKNQPRCKPIQNPVTIELESESKAKAALSSSESTCCKSEVDSCGTLLLLLSAVESSIGSSRLCCDWSLSSAVDSQRLVLTEEEETGCAAFCSSSRPLRA